MSYYLLSFLVSFVYIRFLIKCSNQKENSISVLYNITMSNRLCDIVFLLQWNIQWNKKKLCSASTTELSSNSVVCLSKKKKKNVRRPPIRDPAFRSRTEILFKEFIRLCFWVDFFCRLYVFNINSVLSDKDYTKSSVLIHH